MKKTIYLLSVLIGLCLVSGCSSPSFQKQCQTQQDLYKNLIQTQLCYVDFIKKQELTKSLNQKVENLCVQYGNAVTAKAAKPGNEGVIVKTGDRITIEFEKMDIPVASGNSYVGKLYKKFYTKQEIIREMLVLNMTINSMITRFALIEVINWDKLNDAVQSTDSYCKETLNEE